MRRKPATLLFVLFLLFSSCAPSHHNGVAHTPPAPQRSPLKPSQGMIVRISEIDIDPEYIDAYRAILTEEAEASVRLERGVLAIFPMHQMADPAAVRILEVYSSREAYESHLQ